MRQDQIKFKYNHSIHSFNLTLPNGSALSELNEEDNNIDLLWKGSMKFWWHRNSAGRKQWINQPAPPPIKSGWKNKLRKQTKNIIKTRSSSDKKKQRSDTTNKNNMTAPKTDSCSAVGDYFQFVDSKSLDRLRIDQSRNRGERYHSKTPPPTDKTSRHPKYWRNSPTKQKPNTYKQGSQH